MGGEHAVFDLLVPAFLVAGLAVGGERVVGSGDPGGGGQVEQGQPSGVGVLLAQVGADQLFLNPWLLLQQPVHRVVEFVDAGGSEVGGVFGGGVADAGGEQAHDQVAVPAFGAQQVFEAQAVGEGGDRVDVPVGQRSVDLQVAGGIDQGFAGQGGFERGDGVFGELGDVAQGFVFDLPVFAVGAADQGGAVFHGGAGLVGALASVDGYVHRGTLGVHGHIVSRCCRLRKGDKSYFWWLRFVCEKLVLPRNLAVPGQNPHVTLG